MKTRLKPIFILFSILLLSAQIRAESNKISISAFKPTAFFKKADNGDLKQVLWMTIDNPLGEKSVVIKSKVSSQKDEIQELKLGAGVSEIEVLVPDVTEKTAVNIIVTDAKSNKVLAQANTDLLPQKKWTMYCVTYSHHDLGYGDIPHRLRRDNRMENMELMLKYCSLTDEWPEEAKYRAVLETSEPITSYLSYCNKEKAVELARRINEGRIQVSGIHTTVNTEMLGHEIMARLFYLSNRHAIDLLNIRPSKSINFDDVIGITLPFYTFAKEAGIKNLFHGYNSPIMNFHLPAQNEPLFYMQGADGDNENKVLVRSYYYSGDAIRHHTSKKRLGEDIVQGIADRYEAQNWPFNAVLSQDGWDFTLLTLDNATRIKELNATYAYPRMVCATMDMFFDAIREQSDENSFKTYCKDGNNQWADQPASNARILGIARQMDELIPTAEKMATIGSIVAGENYPWTDIYQGYHRLLLYHEHTCGSSAFKPAYQYAAEEQEINDMANDAAYYGTKVMNNSVAAVLSAISTPKGETVVVFNPLNFESGQNVSVAIDSNKGYKLIDNSTKQEVVAQCIGNQLSFFASQVPALGYKSYTLIAKKRNNIKTNSPFNYRVDNDFYTVLFDTVSGSISSLFDKSLGKELIDINSPYKLNEYLYEHYNVPDNRNESQFYGAKALSFEYTPGAVSDKVVVHQQGEGSASIIQTITLYRTKKQIDFTMEIDKTSSGRSIAVNDAGKLTNKEALYVALPFAVKDYRFKHSLPGMSIEPIKQQFDSVSTASYAMRHFASVYNNEFGIAVAPIQGALVQYGFPRSDAMPGFWGTEHLFEKDPTYPRNSSMYLYLLNNMFDVNIVLDQPGKKVFSYALTSYKKDGENQAERFGWEFHNPLIAKVVHGAQKGSLPLATYSFLSTDKDNVVCTTIKRAEENGEGYICRFVETSGEKTKTRVAAPLFKNMHSVTVTDLVENNNTTQLPIIDNNSFEIELPPFGIVTVRIESKSESTLSATPILAARAINDMQIMLELKTIQENCAYRIYRDTKPDFVPSLINYIGETTTSEYLDAPEHRFGNWINNILFPNTQYYYKAVIYNNMNNKIGETAEVSCKTKTTQEANMRPMAVSGLRAYVVSYVSSDNYVNVHWRSNCEPDIVAYEVYRGSTADFVPAHANKIATIDVCQPGNGSRYNLNEYDYQMCPDKTVLPNRSYYYKVCAIDKEGQKSEVVSSERVTTKMH